MNRFCWNFSVKLGNYGLIQSSIKLMNNCIERWIYSVMTNEMSKPCSQNLAVSLYAQNYVFSNVTYCILHVLIFKIYLSNRRITPLVRWWLNGSQSCPLLDTTHRPSAAWQSLAKQEPKVQVHRSPAAGLAQPNEYSMTVSWWYQELFSSRENTEDTSF